VGTGSFPGVKRPGRGADHPLPPSADEVYLSNCCVGRSIFYLFHTFLWRIFYLLQY
jgi:hypothetical protein